MKTLRGVSQKRTEILGFSLLMLLIFMPAQSANANLIEDLQKTLAGLGDKLKEAVENGLEFSYEKAVEYFESEDYQFKAENLSWEKDLILLIYDTNQQKYSSLLYNITPIQQYEFAMQKFLIQQLLKSIEAEDVGWKEYRSETGTIFEQHLHKQMIAKYSNQQEIHGLNQNLGFVGESACTVFKAIPIYDSERNTPVTLNEAATNIVDDIPILLNSDLDKDPVRFGCVLLMDSDFLLYAKIIKTPTGQWLSVEEAAALGYKTEEVSETKIILKSIDLAMNARNPAKIDQNIIAFTSLVNEINNG